MESGHENRQKRAWMRSSNNAYCPAATTDCVCRPTIASAEDYEIRVQVDFEHQLLRPLGVTGLKPDASLEVLLFVRERCRQDCCCCSESCSRCRTRKLYQGSAAHPKGEVTFVPHTEYLYCMRFSRCHPVIALLSLTPHEQNVEVKELGLLAYWFATWFQRARAALPPRPSELPPKDMRESPSAALAGATAIVANLMENRGGMGSDSIGPEGSRVTAEQVLTMASGNVTSKYLPNMRMVYEVRKNKISITMPNPNQLTREIDIMLVSRGDVEPKLQSTTLKPSVTEASCELLANRNVPYTLMVKLKDLGKPIELLDLITEHKVLRVQESREAPKFMNFLMERRVDQRATFVLHVTFDEKSIEVNQEWLGEFYLDVDTDKQTMAIGTVSAHKGKIYRVEKLLQIVGNNGSSVDADKLLVFEGSVDPGTLYTRDPIPIHRTCEYLISVADPDDGTVLPTTVLSCQKTSLFVREIKGSDVKLHVTVQRQSTGMATDNLNNLADQEPALGPHKPAVRRTRQDGAFHCPIGDGCTKYRILHNTSGRRARAASTASVETAATTSAAADASCRSCGGGSSWEDSGVGCNQTSFSESQDTSQLMLQQRRLQREEQRRQRTDALAVGVDFNVSLDVHLPTLTARLLRGDSDCGAKRAEESASRSSHSSSSSGCFLIVEESMMDGQPRSVPCRLGETFGVQHWCRYTVKSIDERTVSPLFTFCVTDTEVIDVRSCHPMVRLTRSVAKENPQFSVAMR